MESRIVFGLRIESTIRHSSMGFPFENATTIVLADLTFTLSDTFMTF